MATVERAHHCSTTLVGEDTNLMILLLHYSRTYDNVIYFRSDAKNHSKVYNIALLKEKLGNDVCNHWLFVHAYMGCDSTSRIFGMGKKLAFRKLMKLDPVMTSCANALTVQGRSEGHISDLGKHLTVDLFGGKPNDTLSSLRHFIFTKKVATAKSFVTPERLPPTSSATEFHSLRVYYQVMDAKPPDAAAGDTVFLVLRRVDYGKLTTVIILATLKRLILRMKMTL
eukprot:gene2032-2311_t